MRTAERKNLEIQKVKTSGIYLVDRNFLSTQPQEKRHPKKRTGREFIMI